MSDGLKQPVEKSRTGWRPWAEAIAGLIVVSMAAFWLVGFIDRIVMPLFVFSGVEVVVPDLHGNSVQQAEEICNTAGIELERGRVRIDNNHAPGTVLDQSPQAGDRVKAGRKIDVLVSISDMMVHCPDVLGRSPREATLIADTSGLTIYSDSIKYTFSIDYPEGVVLRQSPDPLNQMSRGEQLKIWVSLGDMPSEIIAPDLVGKNIQDVTLVLAKYRLLLGKVTRYPQRGVAEGTVLSQNPAPGTALDVGDRVHLRVAVSPSKQNIQN